MKNIWMLLAAVVLFAACEDKIGDQPNSQEQEMKIVSVSATSAFDYQWQAGDSVKVVFNSETAKKFAAVSGADITVASFSYDVEEVKDVVMDDYVYFVAPGAVETECKDVTVGDAIENKLHMTYSLSATQDGVIGAEENLSYAVLSSETLNGNATVAMQMNSPFAVLDVTLPEGVSSVVFTADNMYGSALVGDATILVGADAVSTVTVKNSSKVVTLENPTGLPTSAKVLVLPGNAKPLAVKMDGVDGSMYETSVLAETTLEAGKVYPVNLAGDDVFSINYSVDGSEAAKLGETVAVSPLGGGLTISIVSLHAGQPTVSENADWISVVENAPVKSFHGDMMLLLIAGNTTGQERQAEVTVNYGEGKSKPFTVTQGTIDMSIVNDAEGNQIVWEESFGLFNTSNVSGTPEKSFTNKFTISLSDDFSKGAYKISNMFKADSYFDENRQPQSNKGADYYADMEGDVLIVHKRDEGNSYPFSDNNITLDFNRTEKTFAAEPIALSDDKYIGNYAVKVFVEQPTSGEGGLSVFVGTWNETFTYTSWSGPEIHTGTFDVSVEGDKLLFTSMFNYKMYSTLYSGTYYGTLSEDGTKITLTEKDSPHGYFGPINYSSEGTIILDVNGTT